MRTDGVSIRMLAARSDIKRSRLGKLLHSDPTRRTQMSYPEFRKILDALGIDLLQALICVESIRDLELISETRYSLLIPMVCVMAKELPGELIQALEHVEGIDGTEVRPEWAGVLRKSVIQRIIHAMTTTASRRAALSELQL